jgi:cathepsin L
MKFIVALVLFIGLAAATFTEVQYQDTFISWMKEQGKMYANDEFQMRFNIFKGNMDFVDAWNAQNSTTVLGLNVFADLSNSEYQNIYLGTHIDGTEALANAEPYVSDFVPEAQKDWRTSGAVTGIKDQGQCGSCWSFSATGAIEGVYHLAHMSTALPSLSEQNLMDCSTAYGNQGCNGGLMTSAFKYVIANKGIDTEASYPYQTKSGTCRFSTANIGATITNYKTVSAGSESALITAINAAPVSVAIDASKSSFQLYKSGTYYEPSCSSSNLDHGVLAIGYDADYFLVKNSWGTGWGMSGYIQMSRNKNNNCGIATSAAYPVA